MARFGRWFWASNLGHFLLNEGDDVVVGRILGTEALGAYRMAFAYANLPATETSHVISQVSFPTFAKLRDDPGRLRRGYLRTVSVTALIAAPASMGIAIMAPAFVRLIIGTQWQAIVLPLQILSVWGFVRAVASTTGPVFNALGRPDVVARLVFARLALMALIILPLTMTWGLPGASFAVVTAALANFPFASAAVVRAVGCTSRDFVAAWCIPAAGAIVMGATVVLAESRMSPAYGLLGFASLVTLGVVVYGALMAAARRRLPI
jgi:PST family polysaccharide transporter/lipopolysaccharide exporter